MIKNEKQYKISKKLLSEINENIANLKKDTTQHPLKIKLLLASALNMQKEVEQDILLYETLKTNKGALLKERLFSDLPSILIE